MSVEDEGDEGELLAAEEGDEYGEEGDVYEGDGEEGDVEDADSEEEANYVDNLDEAASTTGSTFDVRFSPSNQLEKSFLDRADSKTFPGNQFYLTPSLSSVFEEHVLCDQKDLELPLVSLSTSLREFKLLPGLTETWQQLTKRTCVFESAVEANMFSLLHSYRDVWFSNRSTENGKSFMRLAALHVVNHVLKSMRTVAKNNSRLTQVKRQRAQILLERKTAEREAQLTTTAKKRRRRDRNKKNPIVEAYETALAAIKQPEDVQDQGYTRPKVLVMLPVRNDAYKFVSSLLKLIPAKVKQQVLNLKRFESEFSPGESGMDPTKPEDYRDLFEGNTDDCFRLGLGFGKKSVKLFSDFYSSDIIVASPLGLRMVIGTEGDTARDFDFMSSIEILLMDRADVFGMQNWEHMKVILSVLNCKPYELRDTDFSRVRPWVLDGWAKYFRQNIILSSYTSSDLNALFNRHCVNSIGRVKLRPQYSGSLQLVLRQVRQVFQRVPTSSMKSMFDDRFNFFVDNVQTHLKGDDPTVVFIPSYFDYVRVRKHLKKSNIDFCNCADYTKTSIVSRARSDFFHRKKKIMLVTERFHFFRRYKIRGICKVVFYGLPENATFYSEFCNWIEEGDHKTSLALYTKYDALALERIVGSERSLEMLNAQKSIHLFC